MVTTKKVSNPKGKRVNVFLWPDGKTLSIDATYKKNGRYVSKKSGKATGTIKSNDISNDELGKFVREMLERCT